MKRDLALRIGIYALCVILACFLWRWQFVLAICYLSISICMLYRWHKSSDLIFYFVAFGLGPLGEIMAVYFGAWQYTEPFILIPVWLPFLWGIAAVFLKKISERLIDAIETEHL